MNFRRGGRAATKLGKKVDGGPRGGNPPSVGGTNHRYMFDTKPALTVHDLAGRNNTVLVGALANTIDRVFARAEPGIRGML